MFWLFTNKISSSFFYQPRNLLKNIRMNQESLMYKQQKTGKYAVQSAPQL